MLGMHHCWFGLRQYPYRVWLLPVLLSHPYDDRSVMSYLEALEWISPDVVLFDRHVRQVFDKMSNPECENHEYYRQVKAFMIEQEAVLAGTVEDQTYGKMEVYWLRKGRDL